MRARRKGRRRRRRRLSISNHRRRTEKKDIPIPLLRRIRGILYTRYRCYTSTPRIPGGWKYTPALLLFLLLQQYRQMPIIRVRFCSANYMGYVPGGFRRRSGDWDISCEKK